MICQATYDSLEAIPEALRGEFESKDGKWVLKADAIPGVGPLFNPGLEANRNQIRGELVQEKAKVTDLTTRLNQAQEELAKSRQPGGRVLSPDDAKTFDEYTKLGAVKDVKQKVTGFEDLKKKVDAAELKDAIVKVAKEAGLNEEVLSDWASHPTEGEGLSFFVKDVTEKDPKTGQDVVVKRGFVKKSVKKGEEVETSEHPIEDIAKERLPEFKQTALFTDASGNGDKRPAPSGGPVIRKPGVRVPDASSAGGGGTSGDSGNKRPVDRFNEERSKAPSPFDVPKK